MEADNWYFGYKIFIHLLKWRLKNQTKGKPVFLFKLDPIKIKNIKMFQDTFTIYFHLLKDLTKASQTSVF